MCLAVQIWGRLVSLYSFSFSITAHIRRRYNAIISKVFCFQWWLCFSFRGQKKCMKPAVLEMCVCNFCVVVVVAVVSPGFLLDAAKALHCQMCAGVHMDVNWLDSLSTKTVWQLLWSCVLGTSDFWTIGEGHVWEVKNLLMGPKCLSSCWAQIPLSTDCILWAGRCGPVGVFVVSEDSLAKSVLRGWRNIRIGLYVYLCYYQEGDWYICWYATP